ncbi:hypothetical protein D9758_002640 [Tetrapyrgos nigripes]|uniref:Protein kinase domain-containing protein n=1 Tax=Tetrapyrgos nigripes TaxID=182062 RepID=A0A8H5GR03_9AGAR|nr:hypothetical protein D9758_002640 [Tetrapyrgos nigripes]
MALSSPPPPPRKSLDSPGDEDSVIEDVSFQYTMDNDGNLIRNSKGSLKSNHSTPPTDVEQDDPPPKAASKLLQATVAASFLDSPTPPRRGSLSRSESAYTVLNGPSTAASEREQVIASNPARSFHRTASGPVLTSGSSTAGTSTTNTNDAGPIRFPTRRIATEQQRRKRNTDELSNKLQPLSDYESEEKENIARGTHDAPGVDELYGPRHSTSEAYSNVSPGAGPSRSSLPARTAYGSLSTNGSRPLGEVQRLLPAAPARSSKPSKSTGSILHYSRISEAGTEEESDAGQDVNAGYVSGGHIPGHPTVIAGDDTDPEEPDVDAPRLSRLQAAASLGALPLNSSGGPRPRRSASLSDALYFEVEGVRQASQPAAPPPPARSASRPGTSLGLRRELPVIPSRKSSPVEELEVPEVDHARRRSSSPTAHSSHRRRDSDTVRSGAQYSSSQPSSNLAAADPSRRSPTSANGAIPRRLSPSAKHFVSSSNSSRMPQEYTDGASSKHRRSPTAPEPSTTSDGLRGSSQAGRSHGEAMNSWAPDERDNGGIDISVGGGYREVRHQAERRDSGSGSNYNLIGVSVAGPAIPRPQSQPVPAQSQRQSVSTAAPSRNVSVSGNANAGRYQGSDSNNNTHFKVNKRFYARLDLLGKGGSSKVWRVLSNTNEIYALKRVVLEKTDQETLNGYINELHLLRRLEGNKRIIRLIDSEVKIPAPGGKGSLMMLMECAEIDLARLIAERAGQALDMIWVAYYWQQMLQAVQVIHDEKIVHSDLKPANFVIAKGQLKLIDFGIANAIANDTTNIQREHQIGTINYMSPEAIELPEGMRRLKVGRSSDVWSLGCILYQMIYGHPPFYQYTPIQKMKAIPDPSYVIEYPEYSIPNAPISRSSSPSQQGKKLDHLKVRVRSDVIETMKACLERAPKERKMIPELLNQGWLAMEEKVTEVPKTDVSLFDILEEDQAAIDPHYMRQLLKYGILLGQKSIKEPDDCIKLDSETLLKEGERLIKELRLVQQGKQKD